MTERSQGGSKLPHIFSYVMDVSKAHEELPEVEFKMTRYQSVNGIDWRRMKMSPEEHAKRFMGGKMNKRQAIAKARNKVEDMYLAGEFLCSETILLVANEVSR